PQRPGRRFQASSISFSGQSRYFELELSPIIEYPTVAAPLAPSAVIQAEGEGMLGYSRADASPRSCSSFGDVFLTPDQTVGSKEQLRSETGDYTHPRSLMTGMFVNTLRVTVAALSKETSKRGEEIYIPSLILTVPTPDLSNQSPNTGPDAFQHHRQVLDSGLESYRHQMGSGPHVTPLGLVVDNVEVLPRGADDGAGEGSIVRSHAQPQTRTLASRVRNLTLLRRGGRRTWDTLSRFFSVSLVPGTADVSNGGSGGRGRCQGLDLSFASTSTSRWFRSPRQGSKSLIRQMFRN
ncbi:hypothetical protein C0991_007750, partial [Blastosporella zonata]